MLLSEFAGIEERSRADRALLEVNARTAQSHHGDHATAATRADDAIDAVELGAELGVAVVDRFRAAPVYEIFAFKLVKPKALTIDAVVDFDAFEKPSPSGKNIWDIS